MRLGQLARKLSLRPHQIVDFLATRNIAIDDGSNARLGDNHVDLIMQKFAPLSTAEEVAKVKVEDETAPPIAEQVIEMTAITPEISSEREETAIDQNVEELQQEVIKAPKIELQGLKVLGKIDLPEPKKKAEGEVIKPIENAPETRKRSANDDRRPQTYRNTKSEQRTDKNPIALSREREAQEAKLKREEAAEKAKEQRAKNYQKKVKVSAPTKRAKLIDDQVEEFSASDSSPTPTGLWGKIKRWFKS